MRYNLTRQVRMTRTRLALAFQAMTKVLRESNQHQEDSIIDKLGFEQFKVMAAHSLYVLESKNENFLKHAIIRSFSQKKELSAIYHTIEFEILAILSTVDESTKSARIKRLRQHATRSLSYQGTTGG